MKKKLIEKLICGRIKNIIRFYIIHQCKRAFTWDAMYEFDVLLYLITNQKLSHANPPLHHHHHHHHVAPLARISLTLSRHFSLSFIAFGMSSGQHPVSSHRCRMYVRACRPAFAWSYAGVHRSKSLMSLSLLLQQCPACLACLTCIVFVIKLHTDSSRDTSRFKQNCIFHE